MLLPPSTPSLEFLTTSCLFLRLSCGGRLLGFLRPLLLAVGPLHLGQLPAVEAPRAEFFLQGLVGAF
jgi:hypothetical protein